MRLSVDEQWMLAYLNTRIHNWGDVKNDAGKTIHKVKSHDDFVAWVECFLPTSRREEVLRALKQFKQRKRDQKPASSVSQVPVNLDARAAKLLLERAKAEQCSVSEYLLKKLA